ncbi:hypothetical protein EV182_005413, partial [Spiromyces aspiralis]
MYSLQPQIDLRAIQDTMSKVEEGYSFVTEPANRLADAFLALSERACLCPVDGLLGRDGWDRQAVRRYMELHQQMLVELMALVHLTGGQASRATELLCLEHCNGTSTSRGVYIYDGCFFLVTRHIKARTVTNNEFQVARVLPDDVGRLLYQYLVYIRPFTYMLQRHCYRIDINSSLLFCSPQQPRKLWKSAILSWALQQLTESTVGQALGIRLYRQISIAFTKKHVQQLADPFNRFDDRTANADIHVAFAWQSGHRPMQRACAYGLDGAFPDSLQPALLRVYKLISREWHRFLHLERPERPERPEQTSQQPKPGQLVPKAAARPSSATAQPNSPPPDFDRPVFA